MMIAKTQNHQGTRRPPTLARLPVYTLGHLPHERTGVTTPTVPYGTSRSSPFLVKYLLRHGFFIASSGGGVLLQGEIN